MKKTNYAIVKALTMLVLLFTASCSTPVRFTYTAENVKGNAEMNKERMLADYGKFAIQYTSEGGVDIINKSDSTMYIDMGESYYINNGIAQQLFDNSVTTNFSSGTQGATVNMGSVASAMGVGGALGTLARGVNVGGSTTSGSSTQVFEERYISIPPMSRKQMKSFLFEPVNSMNWGKTKNQPWREARDGNRIVEGTYHYDRYSSPAQEYVFAYSFNPNEKFKSTRDLFYVTDIEINKSLKKIPEGMNQTTKKGSTTKDVIGNVFAGIGLFAVLVVEFAVLLMSEAGAL